MLIGCESRLPDDHDSCGVDNIKVPFGLGIIQTAWKDLMLVKYGSRISSGIGRGQPSKTLTLIIELQLKFKRLRARV